LSQSRGATCATRQDNALQIAGITVGPSDTAAMIAVRKKSQPVR